MYIDKAYFTLPEVLERWQINEADLIYLAENDTIRLSVRVFDVSAEFLGASDSEAVPEKIADKRQFSGLLDLYACDAYQLFRCGEIGLSAFRAPRGVRVRLCDESGPITVMIGDLLLRRDERDRFEVANGFSDGASSSEEGTFIHSADYLDVRCNGRRFALGPIQAEVVRALHLAAEAGDPWQNGKTILSQAGSKSLRMTDVFKSQRDWRHLIRSDRRGGYRLAVD